MTYLYYISEKEPKIVDEALKYEFWVNAMQKEYTQFTRNDAWVLVPRPMTNIS